MIMVIQARGNGINRKLKIILCSGRKVSAISKINLYSYRVLYRRSNLVGNTDAIVVEG